MIGVFVPGVVVAVVVVVFVLFVYVGVYCCLPSNVCCLLVVG